MKQTILFILATFLNLSLFAQSSNNASLESSIYTTDGEPAAFATVLLKHADTALIAKAGSTDENGKIIFIDIVPGNYQMQTIYVGFADHTSDVFALGAGETKVLPAVTLDNQAENLAEVTVKAKRPIIEVKADKTILNVEGTISASGENALQLMRKAPGVVVDNNDNILLQGKAGVRIYIDGKPSPLSAADLASYLQGIPSASIDAIEVITNPSSKYDAEGNAGIINIRLKKDKSLGTNATINAGLSVGQHFSHDAGIQFNYRQRKLNVFGNYNYNNHEGEQFYNFRRTIIPFFFDQQSGHISDNTSHNIKTGLDFFLDDKNTIGVLIHGSQADGNNTGYSNSLIYFDKENDVPDQRLVAQNLSTSERSNYNVNLNYVYDNKKGQTINFDADYGQFIRSNNSLQPNTYYNPANDSILNALKYMNDSETAIDIYTVKVDVEQPVGKATLGYGAKYAQVKTDNRFFFYDITSTGEQILDPDRTNSFFYDEQVSAGYVNFSRAYKKWSYQLGLRGEHTHSTGQLTSLKDPKGKPNKRTYFDFFPSGGVTYNVDQKNTMRITYSRRLTRPNYQNLNPFEFKLDELTFRRGNPFLSAQYTHNIQLGHTFNYRLNTTLSYSHTTDFMTNITDTAGINQAFIIWENLADQKVWNLSVSYPFRLGEKWSVFVNGGATHLQNTSIADDDRFTAGKEIDIAVQFFNIYAQSTYQLPANFTLELSGYYTSPSIWGGNFKTQEYWNVDFGVQKTFLDNRLRIKAGISDIFKSQEWEAENAFGILSTNANGGYDSRRFKLNATYNFGNSKVRQARKRKTGLEEEKSRARESS